MKKNAVKTILAVVVLTVCFFAVFGFQGNVSSRQKAKGDDIMGYSDAFRYECFTSKNLA